MTIVTPNGRPTINVIRPLAKLALRHKISARAASKDRDLLKKAGIDRTLLTPTRVKKAEAILSQLKVLLKDELAAGLLEEEPEPTPEPAEEPSKAKEPAPKRDISVRHLVLGKPASAVIRALGYKGWDFDKVRKVMPDELSDTTIRCQLHGAKTKTRGKPADLTDKELKKLEKMTK